MTMVDPTATICFRNSTTSLSFRRTLTDGGDPPSGQATPRIARQPRAVSRIVDSPPFPSGHAAEMNVAGKPSRRPRRRQGRRIRNRGARDMSAHAVAPFRGRLQTEFPADFRQLEQQRQQFAGVCGGQLLAVPVAEGLYRGCPQRPSVAGPDHAAASETVLRGEKAPASWLPPCRERSWLGRHQSAEGKPQRARPSCTGNALTWSDLSRWRGVDWFRARKGMSLAHGRQIRAKATAGGRCSQER